MNERELYNELTSNVDSIEYAPGQPAVSSGVGAGVAPIRGNPLFVSQFDINLTIKYYLMTFTRTATTDIWSITSALTAPGSLPTELQTDVAAFIFGKADAVGGMKRNNQLFPVANWIYNMNKSIGNLTPVYDWSSTIYDYETVSFKSPSFVDGAAVRGDIVQSYVYEVPGGTGTDFQLYLCEVRIECKQVAYGTLLDATSSDRFTINNIRYKVPDSTKTAQFEKQLRLIRQSLFGKLSTDDISPAAYQKPEQFQVNIVDIPLIKGIDKESSIGTYLNYDVGEILLSIFVSTQKKVVEKVG